MRFFKKIITAMRRDTDQRNQIFDLMKENRQQAEAITRMQDDVSFWRKNSDLWQQAAEGWRQLAAEMPTRNNQQVKVLRVLSGGRPAEPEKPPFADR